jgi:glycosyltransferase involved in cell wall biosynthesis
MGNPNASDSDSFPASLARGGGNRLDRKTWHRPLISIIVTHFNYSAHLKEALLSLLDQTHENWECVIVDDASEVAHKEGVTAILDELRSDKIKVIWLEENVGQIPAFFAGLDATCGHFVCLLDPDDRYAETFLAEALATHLNRTVVCPIVSTDQYTVHNAQITTASHSGQKIRQCKRIGSKAFDVTQDDPYVLYFRAEERGWFWSSTSAMMFRRAALKYLRPHKQLLYKGSADAYLAPGAHLLGGTLLLAKPLVYRMLHHENRYIRTDFFSTFQNKIREDRRDWSGQCRADVIEALEHRKASISPAALAVWTGMQQKKPGLAQRLRRSILKRWHGLASGKTDLGRSQTSRLKPLSPRHRPRWSAR